ncbi:MAG TPA: LutB/LldF family L-lactate oxidation iron-sulfur protein [Terriglobales bacterium]|nr:LutB/LldF family L-lactate oxidation iron-sulfur protein [Terriglobales bacterium]
MRGTAAQEFLRQSVEKTADLEHRRIIRWNIDNYDTAVNRGKSRFADWQAARDRCQQVKREALARLDDYLLQFEKQVVARGGKVFWASNSEEARNYVTELAVARGVKRIVKSKSMVTEEIHLSPALEKAGIEVWETDLGEYIVQLRNEPPYHIVTPAMHLTRLQIAELFRAKLPDVTADDHQSLVAAARRALRKAFFSSEMGISGANFIVADAGMIAISTNEGNGRLCTSVPRIHVAVTGIEKVVPRLQDLAVLWPVLATAGTGQPITTYSTLIGGPRQPGEADGPEEFHVVLVDNGRSQLLADPEQREVLHCIRCGACLNACPVFRHVGGHSYGTTYQGPIGSVLTPHLRGQDFNHLSFASSLCGACAEVCPVRISLHHHLLENRRNAVRTAGQPWKEGMGFKLWSWAMRSASRYRVLTGLARRAARILYSMGYEGSWIDPAAAWTAYRAAPAIPRQSFRQWWESQDGKR